MSLMDLQSNFQVNCGVNIQLCRKLIISIKLEGMTDVPHASQINQTSNPAPSVPTQCLSQSPTNTLPTITITPPSQLPSAPSLLTPLAPAIPPSTISPPVSPRSPTHSQILWKAKNLSKQIEQHSYNSSLVFCLKGTYSTAVSNILEGKTKIRKKMMAKLLSWMHNLCVNTLSFSVTTFEISVKIMLDYLGRVDEEPKHLQMLACVCLHIGSKLMESHIVSINSYIECCLNIFTHQQFEQKQAIIFDMICKDNTIGEPTAVQVAEFIGSEIDGETSGQQVVMSRLEKALVELDAYKVDGLKMAILMWAYQVDSNVSLTELIQEYEQENQGTQNRG